MSRHTDCCVLSAAYLSLEDWLCTLPRLTVFFPAVQPSGHSFWRITGTGYASTEKARLISTTKDKQDTFFIITWRHHLGHFHTACCWVLNHKATIGNIDLSQPQIPQASVSSLGCVLLSFDFFTLLWLAQRH